MTRQATRHPGFTMVELVLGLAISSVVLSAAAALAFAVSRAWTSSEDINSVITHGRTGLFQLSDRVRGARAIGYTTPGTMLLWREDANGDGRVNESELSVVFVQAGQLVEGRYVFDSSVTQAVRDANNAVVTPADFASPQIVARLGQNQFYRTGPLAENVHSVAWLLNETPPRARLVHVTLRISKNGLTQTLVCGMALRAPLEVR